MKFVIGNGLAGLIFAYYNTDYFLIGKTENAGGQFNINKQLGPRYIKFNKKLEKLLQVLKIEYSLDKLSVGYLYKNELTNSLTENMKKEYNIKVRGVNKTKGSLNSNKKQENILIFDVKELIDKLTIELHNRIINDTVKSINIKTKTIKLTKISFKYDKIINTINYIDFCKLCKMSCNIKCNDIYFYYINGLYINGCYDYIYLIDKDYIINRISQTNSGIIIESPKRIKGLTEEYILKNSKLKGNYKLKKIKNIIYFGRYAEMNNEIRIDTLFDKIGELHDI